MKNIITFAAAAMVMVAAPAFAQNTATSPAATASATVIAPITITKDTDLAFGTIVAGYTAPVVVDTLGARTGGGTNFLVNSTASAATFTVGGDNRAFTASTNAVTGTIAGNLTLSAVAQPVSISGGTAAVAVGGSLALGLAAGSYTGSFTVTASYN